MLRRTFLQTTASAVASPALAQESPYITLASARSAARSGLLAHIVPLFRAETGINVHVVAVGTRQALAIGARGEADVLLLHHRAVEDRFVAEGHGLDRRSVMSDDFVLVGPQNDPAGIRGQRNAVEALKRIAAARPPFASRGDASGTHRMELQLWTAARLDPRAALGSRYLILGRGMGRTLEIAAALEAYTLTDRATWASFKDRQRLELLVEADPALFHPYASILVNPNKGSHTNAMEARIWHEWLTSDRGRVAIASYRLRGEQLFYPTGTRPGI